jgi:hypothetical protein
MPLLHHIAEGTTGNILRWVKIKQTCSLYGHSKCSWRIRHTVVSDRTSAAYSRRLLVQRFFSILFCRYAFSNINSSCTSPSSAICHRRANGTGLPDAMISGVKRKGEGTPRKLATATKPLFPRIVINLSSTRVTEWSSANWGNGNATRWRLRNSTSRQRSKPVFSQLRCCVVS